MTQHLYNGVLFSKIMLFSDVGKRILPKNIFSFLSPTNDGNYQESGERKRDILSMSVSVAS